MIELPPAIQLIKSEIKIEDNSPQEILKDIKKLIPELMRQSEWALENFDYSDSPNIRRENDFAISPVSGLNPFDNRGKCSELNCRIKTALNFSRTFGLYGDVIYVPDSFTDILSIKDKWSDTSLRHLCTEIIIIKILLPLIESGVIRFTHPIQPYCISCMEKMEQTLEILTYEMLEDVVDEVNISFTDSSFSIDTHNLHIPSIIRNRYFKSKVSKKTIDKNIQKALYDLVSDEVHNHLFAMNSARDNQATVVSNSRLGLDSLKRLEGTKNELNNVEWERARTIELPWVSKLMPAEIVMLREDASQALPQFRELMHRKIVLENDGGLDDDEKKTHQMLSELRVQAIDVKSEIERLGQKNDRFFYNLTEIGRAHV